MKNILIIFLLTMLFANYSDAQVVKGKVYSIAEGKKEFLEDAVVKWINTSKGTLTDEKGNFEISSANITDKRFITILVGYKTDTVVVGEKEFTEIELKANLVTSEIKVEGERKSTYTENTIQKTEVLTALEFKKEACCDLSGCFGRNSTVDVQVTDLLTDSKELKLLGLEGAYTTLLVDNMPLLGGMVSKYGVSGIPGPLIDKIMISKGANSVFQGYESISGTVNVLMKSYENSDRVFLNVYMNSGLEKQFNASFNSSFRKWKSLLAFHTVQKSNRMDDNKDSFLDNPLVTRYYFYNKWNYGDEKDKTKFYLGMKYWNEQRIGGQTGFDINNEGSSVIYGQTAKINNGDVYTRIVHEFSKQNVLKILSAAGIYDFKSYYGTTKYNGRQKDFYLNAAYEHPLSELSLLRVGFTYKYQFINEDIIFTQPSAKTYNGNYVKKDLIPGIFIENSYDLIEEKLSVLAGVRLDYHGEHKSVVTPRILIKIEPFGEVTLIRASFGTGFRTINLFTEHSNILASSRDIVIAENLNPEKIINYGVNLLQYFGSRYISGNLNVDFYRTEFSNKIIPDYDTDPGKVIFTNLNGKSFSNVLQGDLAVNFYNTIDFKLSYKFIDLRYTKDNVEYEQPFTAKHRIITTLSYKPEKGNWSVDGKMQWFGKQRLPSTLANPSAYQRPSESEPYSIVGLQFTKGFASFEIYSGVENLLNFRQDDPIISADKPYGQYFDTSFIWGPTRGREFYLGLRFNLK